MKTPNNYEITYYDALVGKHGPRVLIGDSALNRHGLLTVVQPMLQCETPYKDISGIGTYIVQWFYTDSAEDFSNTVDSPKSSNIKVPTVERALVEYIKYLNYFSEGMLIEALVDYLWRFNNLGKLYECADTYNLPRETLDYWLNEARNETSE